MGSQLPRSVAAITPEWLTQTLRASGALPRGRVTAIDVVDVHGGVALMSHMSRLLITYDSSTRGTPDSLIAKFPPTDPESHSAGLELGFFEGESEFYKHLASRTEIRAPECYFSEFDASVGTFAMLLEDLSEARLGDVTAGCTEQEAAVAVEALAGLHASWWNNDNLGAYGWLRKFEDRHETIVGLLPVAWPTFESRFHERLETRQFNQLLKLAESSNASRRIRFSGVRTLLHGDFKLDNLFFLPSSEIVTCDWGMVMTGHAMFDVASFLALNLPVEQRRRLDSDLVRRYVATLHTAGVRDYDFDRAMADYASQLAAFPPRLIAAGGLARFADEHALEEYALGLRRVVTALDDHGGLDSIPGD